MWASYRYEPRSAFAQFLLEGHLLLLLLLMVLVFLYIEGIYYLLMVKLKKSTPLLIYSDVLLLPVGIAFFLSLKFLGDIKEDRIIYRSSQNPSEKLVAQYYETGVTRTPRWRVIQVNDLPSELRRFHKTHLDLNTVSGATQKVVGEKQMDFARIPKKLVYEYQTYLLEQTHLFDGRLIKEATK
ncbi:hypothetical protein TH63_11050 [Rufibacter radiotolerans]|uniref:Uncharacterized protein n=2 Tax=Rufibacter radiotolerans TaxID=1379910 RepID=A0A0H4VQ55_9BACT|nr:hypothetical protein TH63_11050 [Rufibacter radiotolerans]